MSDSERLHVLRATNVLSGYDDKQLRALLPFFDEVCFPAGVELARENSLCHEFFVVAGGELETCRRGRVGRLGPGDSFGWQAMRDRGLCDSTVVTMSDVRLLVMSHAQFRSVGALELTNAVRLRQLDPVRARALLARLDLEADPLATRE